MSAAARPRGLRRIERWVVGLAMAIVAVLLEKIVDPGLKRRGQTIDEEPEPTTLTSRGGEVDYEPD